MAGEIIRRPDLEAQAVSYPEYIVDRILPYYSRPQVAGNVYYQKFKADVAAQTGRNIVDGSIDQHIIAASDVTFACKEIRSRIKMGYAQIRGYKDKAIADLAMGRMAKRAFYNSIEKAAATALLGQTDVIDATTDPVAAIDESVAILRDKGIGRIALVMSNHNFVMLKNNPTVRARMRNTGVAIEGLAPRYITHEQMAAIFGVDEVISGRDDLWYAGISASLRGRIAVVVLPTREILPEEEVQLGRSIYFDFQSDAEHFVMESWHDNQNDMEVVDAKGLVDIKLLNPVLSKVISAFSASDDSDSQESDSQDSNSTSESVSA